MHLLLLLLLLLHLLLQPNYLHIKNDTRPSTLLLLLFLLLSATIDIRATAWSVSTTTGTTGAVDTTADTATAASALLRFCKQTHCTITTPTAATTGLAAKHTVDTAVDVPYYNAIPLTCPPFDILWIDESCN